MEPSVNVLDSVTFKKDTPKPDVKKSSWFTPCRRLGLKRKSPAVSAPGSAVSSLSGTPNSSFKSHRPRQSFETPFRKNNESYEVKAAESEVINPSACTRVDTLEPVQTSVCLIKDESLSTQTDCAVLKNACPIQTSLLSPCNKITPIKSSRLTTKYVTPTPTGTRPSKPITDTETDLELTEENVKMLRKRVKEKEERVSAMKLAQLYKKKHDTGKLSELTKKWLTGCQDALLQLYEKTKALGYEHTMSELLVQLRIPLELVQYDPDLEDFKE